MVDQQFAEDFWRAWDYVTVRNERRLREAAEWWMPTNKQYGKNHARRSA